MPARKLSPTQAAQLAADVARGMTKIAAAEVYGVSYSTIKRTLKRDAPRANAKPTRKLKPCGTNAAYQRHRRKGEKCPKCWEAHAKEIRKWKRRDELKAQRERQARSRARRRAASTESLSA